MDDFVKRAEYYLNELCVKIPERPTGSKGNILATQFFDNELKRSGWETETPSFEVMDWKTRGAYLQIEGREYEVFASPYSNGCDVTSEVITVTTIEELENCDAKSKIIFLKGKIANEQIMPKNFVFYNPEHHQKIISLLENSQALALICATGKNPEVAGGIYPFPLIEDGDFNIPSVYMTEEEASKFIPAPGQIACVKSFSQRIQSAACNVIARKGINKKKKIVVTAHIDAKIGTPGALDNAGGVIVLMLLADLLKDYRGTEVELIAFNGEDYYAVSGQMNYIFSNQNKFDEILLNINIDGAGYKEGKSAVSFYDVPEEIKTTVYSSITEFNGIKEGVQWPQGDHSIFVYYGRPAIAVSSDWFTTNIGNQDITHTKKDVPEIIDCSKLVEIAKALADVIIKIDESI